MGEIRVDLREWYAISTRNSLPNVSGEFSLIEASMSMILSVSPESVTLCGLFSQAIVTPSVRNLTTSSLPSPIAAIEPDRSCNLVT
jgi:hypothetical protein